MEEARQGRNGMKENTYRIIIIIIIAFVLRLVPLAGFLPYSNSVVTVR